MIASKVICCKHTIEIFTEGTKNLLLIRTYFFNEIAMPMETIEHIFAFVILV